MQFFFLFEFFRAELQNTIRSKAEVNNLRSKRNLNEVPLQNGHTRAVTHGYLTNYTPTGGDPGGHRNAYKYSGYSTDEEDGGFRDYIPHQRKLLPYTHSYSPHYVYRPQAEAPPSVDKSNYPLDVYNSTVNNVNDINGINTYKANSKSTLADQSECFCIECRPDLYHDLYATPRHAINYTDCFNKSFRFSEEYIKSNNEYYIPSDQKFGYTNKGFYI